MHLVPEVLSCLTAQFAGSIWATDRSVGAWSRRRHALGGDVTWELAGQLDHREVLSFYERHHVDALLSLSLSEGLPVSMMEAQSYGIPIVACAVHGVPEIVNERTGILLPPDGDSGRDWPRAWSTL